MNFWSAAVSICGVSPRNRGSLERKGGSGTRFWLRVASRPHLPPRVSLSWYLPTSSPRPHLSSSHLSPLASNQVFYLNPLPGLVGARTPCSVPWLVFFFSRFVGTRVLNLKSLFPPTQRKLSGASDNGKRSVLSVFCSFPVVPLL